MRSLFAGFVGIFLLLTGIQAQAIVACSYSETACDDQGNHYRCVRFGWSGDIEFCSDRDVGPKSQSFSELLAPKGKDWFKECVVQCMKETGHSQDFCGGQYCW